MTLFDFREPRARTANELSTAVARSVSLQQLYGTVCLLTLLTLHH